MKRFLVPMIMLAALSSCKKQGGSENGTHNTENNIPSSFRESTRFHVYMETSNLSGIPLYIDVNLNQLFKEDGHYTKNSLISSDIFKSSTSGLNNMPGPAVCPDRFFSITAGSRNYVDVNFIKHELEGHVQNGVGQWALPGNGKITYSASSFIALPGGSSLYFTYIN